MSQIDKIIRRLKDRPRTFKYSDAKRIFEHLGYVEDTGGATSGSYVQFKHPEYSPINLHRPHPGKELKSYMIRFIAEKLEDEGLI